MIKRASFYSFQPILTQGWNSESKSEDENHKIVVLLFANDLRNEIMGICNNF